LLGILYSRFARSRRRYFEQRPDLRRRLTAPVVSVGNLTVGGSGKTPLVAEIARLLLEMGERPSILSRGYGRTRTVDGVVVVSDGREMKCDVAHAGDEPFMLAREVPRAVVLVSASRYVAGRLAESRFGCTVHLLDDGFQHLPLMRDVDLLVTPPGDFQHVRSLPFGRFREPLDAATKADALLVPVSDHADRSAVIDMAERLKLFSAFSFSRSIDPPASPAPAYAFAGIAKPDQFFAELEQSGWTLAGRRAFRDHHWYSARELKVLQRSAAKAGAALLVTTVKDAVRLAAFSGSVAGVGGAAGVPIVEVPLHVSIEPAFTPWLQAKLVRARAA
jgi:tetraacyldisaccharide 4'-kinase